MKILIVSDTHRRNENLKTVLSRTAPIDMLIHLGDVEGSENVIRSWLEPGVDFEIVKGNNDFFSDLDMEKEIMIGKYKVLLTHGHMYNISLGVEILRQEAIARGFDIAMFGHTHKPYFENEHGVIILNPGSISYPRQDGRKPSYMLMEIDRNGEAHFTQNYLED
jgi:putative phosphoesterase